LLVEDVINDQEIMSNRKVKRNHNVLSDEEEMQNDFKDDMQNDVEDDIQVYMQEDV
jgi:hypothetical protein